MRTVDLTRGPIFGSLVRFSLPMIAGNLLQQIYNLADTLIVGRCIGAGALAAVGSVYTLMIFVTSIIIGLCMGSGTFFSVDHGAGDTRRLQTDIRLSFWFILAVTAGLYALCYPGMGAILCLLQTPAELLGMTRAYVQVVFGGLVFTFLYNFFAYLLRALGNTRVPLAFLAVACVLNIGLDLWFVAGLRLGVTGAAWATVIAQAFSGVGITVFALRRVSLLHGKRGGGLPVDRARLWQIISGDVATGLQQSVMNFGILMIQGLVNSFGTVVMAAFAAAVKIDTLAYLPAQEFGNGYSLFVSQNYGAGQPERIRRGSRLAFLTSAGFCCVVSVFICLFAKGLMGLFVDSDQAAIIAAGVRYLRIEGAAYVGIGVLFLWYGYFRGVERPKVSLLLTVVSLGTRVALSYALAPHTALGVMAIWLSIPIGWVLADLLGLALYRPTAKRLEQQLLNRR